MDELRAVFATLADPTRRALLARLANGEATVNELASPHSMTLPSISRHLKALEQARLVTKSRNAQWRFCRLNPSSLLAVDQLMGHYRRFFETRLDGLEKHLTTIFPATNESTDRKKEHDVPYMH